MKLKILKEFQRKFSSNRNSVSQKRDSKLINETKINAKKSVLKHNYKTMYRKKSISSNNNRSNYRSKFGTLMKNDKRILNKEKKVRRYNGKFKEISDERIKMIYVGFKSILDQKMHSQLFSENKNKQTQSLENLLKNRKIVSEIASKFELALSLISWIVSNNKEAVEIAMKFLERIISSRKEEYLTIRETDLIIPFIIEKCYENDSSLHLVNSMGDFLEKNQNEFLKYFLDRLNSNNNEILFFSLEAILHRFKVQKDFEDPQQIIQKLFKLLNKDEIIRELILLIFSEFVEKSKSNFSLLNDLIQKNISQIDEDTLYNLKELGLDSNSNKNEEKVEEKLSGLKNSSETSERVIIEENSEFKMPEAFILEVRDLTKSFDKIEDLSIELENENETNDQIFFERKNYLNTINKEKSLKIDQKELFSDKRTIFKDKKDKLLSSENKENEFSKFNSEELKEMAQESQEDIFKRIKDIREKMKKLDL